MFVHHYSHALTLRITNHHKMSAYLTPGRGVVNTSGRVSTPVYCWCIASHGHACLSITTAMPTPYVFKITTRWLPILLQEGVWSKPVVPWSRVSTHVYCWCIASHGHACCPSLQHAHTLDFKNHHKMAAYLTPGRGLVKISGTLK